MNQFATPSQHDSLLQSAGARVRHMSGALDWFNVQLSSNPAFGSEFLKLAELLCKASSNLLGTSVDAVGRQVHFVAVGKSGGVAQVLVSMFSSVGISARFLHPTEAFHGDFGSVWENDTVVCVSNNGRSSELLQVLPKLKERQCQLFAITSRDNSPLAKACDHVLLLPALEEFCPLNQAPITSTVATLALGQLLVAASMEIRAFDLEKYARNHPGGAIGKRIFVRVDSLMSQGPALPGITETATFTECVSAMTRFSLGALLVLREKSLVGLISEKDLRTAMEKWGPHVFSKSAADIMNPSPLVVKTGTLAIDALRIMENLPRPLSVLPIVTDHHEAAGLLRLHDLVAEGISLS